MQFTKAEEYGIFGVLYLADVDGDRVVPLSEITQAMNIPEKFLAKIFQSLSKNGVIRSHRGVRGGFALARKPENISVREILETIQGPYHLMQCTKGMELCCRSCDYCALREVLLLAENRLTSVFDAFSLADLAQWQKDKKTPEKATQFA